MLREIALGAPVADGWNARGMANLDFSTAGRSGDFCRNPFRMALRGLRRVAQRAVDHAVQAGD
jgi:hypothetical protein